MNINIDIDINIPPARASLGIGIMMIININLIVWWLLVISLHHDCYLTIILVNNKYDTINSNCTLYAFDRDYYT